MPRYSFVVSLIQLHSHKEIDAHNVRPYIRLNPKYAKMMSGAIFR